MAELPSAPAPASMRVGQPRTPPVDVLAEGLAEIFALGQLTNGGPKHDELERRLAEFVGTPEVALTASGTSALQLACQGLGLSGDVVTTPFTFPATVNAALLAGLRPVFADVEPGDLTLDPVAVEAALTPATSAILAVHLFGGTADVPGLQDVANRHGLRLVFDAAHAFGVVSHGVPVGLLGDASAFSFHATKIFHTLEGGAVACKSAALRSRIERLRNHGLGDGGSYLEPGTNAKLNELQALIGLHLLDGVGNEIAGREVVDSRYREAVEHSSCLRAIPRQEGVAHNFSFFPVEVVDGCADDAVAALRRSGVHARRYFAEPCHLCERAPFRLPVGSMPVAERACSTTVCLPIDARMSHDEIALVCEVLTAL